MTKLLPILLLAAACGGGKSKPAAKTEPVAPPVEAKPADPAPPVEAKPDEATLAASALAEQYAVGKEVYTKNCASCHGDNGEGNAKNPKLVGDGALPQKSAFKGAKLRKTVAFETAKDVFDFVKKNMPLKKGGSLSDDEYLAVLAWDLNENKVNLTKKLATDNLAEIELR